MPRPAWYHTFTTWMSTASAGIEPFSPVSSVADSSSPSTASTAYTASETDSYSPRHAPQLSSSASAAGIGSPETSRSLVIAAGA